MEEKIEIVYGYEYNAGSDERDYVKSAVLYKDKMEAAKKINDLGYFSEGLNFFIKDDVNDFSHIKLVQYTLAGGK